MKQPIRVNSESNVTLQVIAFEEESTLLPGSTGDGYACFIQEGEVRRWLVVAAPWYCSVAFKIQVPEALYHAVLEASKPHTPKHEPPDL